MAVKYVFVTGGVVSGLGKGITAASLGRLLKMRGYKVTMQKFDPYINIDPGTMNPIQHGEVFVTDDGAETDLDLGHYERFIDESNSDTAGKIDKIDTNHVIVNSILNTKYREAREKKIVFVVKVNDLSTLKIKDEDIVLILSNLLNNAIEACEKSERPVIKVKIMKEQKQIIIAVINTIDKEPKEECGKFITSKEENTELHGIGIQNIKDTVEKYGGTCVIRYDQMIFQFIIVISEN